MFVFSPYGQESVPFRYKVSEPMAASDNRDDVLIFVGEIASVAGSPWLGQRIGKQHMQCVPACHSHDSVALESPADRLFDRGPSEQQVHW